MGSPCSSLSRAYALGEKGFPKEVAASSCERRSISGGHNGPSQNGSSNTVGVSTSITTGSIEVYSMPLIGVIVRDTLGDRANSMSKRSDSSFDLGDRKGIFLITVCGLSGIPEVTLPIQQSAMKKKKERRIRGNGRVL